MRFKKLLLILIVVFFSSILFADYQVFGKCDCGVYHDPFVHPYFWFKGNYESISTTEGEGLYQTCNISCRDDAGSLIEFCRKTGKYYTYMSCEMPAYFSIGFENCSGDKTQGSCPTDDTVKTFRNFFLEEVDLNKDFDDCSFVLNGDILNDPKVFASDANKNNGCCGDEVPDDLGFMAEDRKFVCIDNSTTASNKYHWLGAGQNWFKIFTVDRSETKSPVVYDVVSNAERWFVCQPGVPIEGPTYTVEIIPPEKPLTGASPGLGQGTVASTVGGGVGIAPILAPPPTTSGSETSVIDISNFGADFEILNELTAPTAENDLDGDGYVDINMGGTDCDDLNPTIYPGAQDPCGDGIDQDCDFQTHIAPDGAYCQPLQVTLSVPSLAERFMCFNEDKKGTFAECCGYDTNNCYNEIPKGRRQGAVLTTIEEFQEGCPRTSNCVLEFGLVPYWTEPFYAFDISIEKTDFQLHNWVDYESLEFFIYLSDDFVQDIAILGEQIVEGEGTSFNDYELLFFQPITKYAVNTVSLRKWMHIVIPLNDPNWVDPPDYVSHIVFYADTEKVKTAGGQTQTKIANSQITNWENVIGLDRFFLKPKTTTNYCTGTNKPTWINDLDDANKDIYEVEFGKAACQSTPTFGWTGSKCCGDDTTKEEQEYFADSLAGCWKGNTVPPDTTIMNVEYELTYQVPTYSKRQINVPAEYKTQEFEYLIYYLRKDLLPFDPFYRFVEINLSKKVTDFGAIQAELPGIVWTSPTRDIGDVIPEFKGHRYCPANYAAIRAGAHGVTISVSGISFTETGQMQKIRCAPLIDNIKGEPIIVTQARQRGLDGESGDSQFCPENYALCGYYDNKDSTRRFRFVYCCRMIGAKVDLSRARRINIPEEKNGWGSTCYNNEIICGIRRPQEQNGASYYCCPLVTTTQFMISDDNESIDTYFEPSASEGNYLADDNSSHVMAVSDTLQMTGGKQAFKATVDGTRTETRRFTQTCSKDECEYPYIGEIPPTCGQIICGQEAIGEYVRNLHPDLYNISVDYNKSLIKVTRIRQEILFWNETFYGCNASDYTMNVDPDLNIDNSAQMCDIVGTHFCSPSQGWNNKLEGAPNSSSRNTVKSTPAEYPIQSASCCPANYCWNDTACVQSEAAVTELVNPLIEGDKIWRCLDGNWSLSIKRYTWDFSQSGFCPTLTQCLVDPAGNPEFNNQPETYDPTKIDVPQCIESGQFIQDHYCFNGTWTSRTKLIALQFLDIVNKTGDIDNYTLFCDNYKNALANYDYFSIEDMLRGKLYAMPPISIYTCSDSINYAMPCVNNFCVLKYTDRSSGEQKVLFGTSLNKPVNDPEFSFLRALDQMSTYCSNLQGTGFDFRKCSNDPNIWYSDAINSVIFSKTGAVVGQLSIIDSFLRFLFNPITSIINYVVDTIAPRAEPSGALIDYNFTKNVKDFNQMYINRLFDISIKAIIEEPQLDRKFITIKYFEVPEDICLAVDVYDRANPPDGQISCTKEDSVYYVISDQKVAFDVWTDFTSKLRPVNP